MVACDFRQRRRVLVLSLLAALGMVAAALVHRHLDLSHPWDVLVALSPLPFFAWMMVDIVDLTGRLDEFQRRVQLEALAIGFLGTAVAMVAWGQLQRIDVAPDLDLGLAWAGMAFFYVVGVLTARRRYQ